MNTFISPAGRMIDCDKITHRIGKINMSQDALSMIMR